MNQFYLCIGLLKDLLQADIDVNTITHGATVTIDNQKKNIFPISHITILSSGFPSGSCTFSFDVAVVDQRNKSQQVVTDKFLKNDNELDNLNTCHAVLNRLITTLRTQLNEHDIELINDPEPVPILLEYTNGLDGWVANIQLSIPNNRINVCTDQ